jgi:hypothetical protein
VVEEVALVVAAEALEVGAADEQAGAGGDGHVARGPVLARLAVAPAPGEAGDVQAVVAGVHALAARQQDLGAGDRRVLVGGLQQPFQRRGRRDRVGIEEQQPLPGRLARGEVARPHIAEVPARPQDARAEAVERGVGRVVHQHDLARRHGLGGQGGQQLGHTGHGLPVDDHDDGDHGGRA